MAKAQAAMEFLMTYGWAIVVVVIAISALAYFGVLTPDNFIPKKCTFSVGLSCLDHEIEESTGTVQFYVKNNLGGTIQNVQITLPSCSWSSSSEFANGDPIEATLEGCNIQGNGKLEAQPTITYTKKDSGLTFNDAGSISANVGSGSGSASFTPYNDSSECNVKTCKNATVVGGECVYNNLPAYSTHPGECNSPNYCDGNANCVECINNNDCDDTNPCTTDTCNNGVCENPNLPYNSQPSGCQTPPDCIGETCECGKDGFAGQCVAKRKLSFLVDKCYNMSSYTWSDNCVGTTYPATHSDNFDGWNGVIAGNFYSVNNQQPCNNINNPGGPYLSYYYIYIPGIITSVGDTLYIYVDSAKCIEESASPPPP